MGSDSLFPSATGPPDDGKTFKIKIDYRWRKLVAGLLQPLLYENAWSEDAIVDRAQMVEWANDLYEDLYG